ncbi:MAG: dephospho-CoA kinase [Anaerolineae bacterium]|nr:dephospho-CoA kinase [Anaerolineae bacterium]
MTWRDTVGRWEGKYVIGLTGNIATGKSLVRRMLEHLGAYTIDADGLAHQAMAPGAPAYKPVIVTFGQWILDSEQRIDRSKLGAVAFSHPEALTRLEGLTHPIVGRAIDTLIKRAHHKVVVVEAIKLLEGQLADQMDAIWVVDSTEERQRERLQKRGLSDLEALKRIRGQNPQADKLARADVVISNNSTPEDTWKQVRASWSKIEFAAEAEARASAVKRVEVKPAAAPAVSPAEEMMTITALDIVRGMPRNAGEIAQVIFDETGKQLSRQDVLMAFGQKSYMLAMVDEHPVGLVGFLVENLVTRVDEFLVIKRAPVVPVAAALIQAVEQASRDLQSEASYVFIQQDRKQIFQTLIDEGYKHQALDEIKVPAWREAVRESRPDDTDVLYKKLRAERVLKPL